MVTRDSQFPERAVKRPEETSEKSPAIASPYDRIAAAVIDYFILLMPVLYLAAAPFQRRLKEAAMFDDNLTLALSFAGGFLAVCLVIVLYQGLMHWLVRGTVGKLLMGLRVVNVWTRGNPSLGSAMLRAAAWVFSGLSFGIPFFAIFGNLLRRPLHDRLAETMVISVARGRSVAAPSYQEAAMVRGVYLAFGIAFTLIVATMFTDVISSMTEDSGLVKSLESEDKVCAAIGEAQREWPGSDKVEVPRLDVALSLYMADQIDLDCIESEIEFLHAPDEENASLFLAKALVYSVSEDLSDAYVTKVCDLDLQSEECALGLALKAERRDTDEDRAFIASVAAKFKNTTKAYLQIWAVHQMLDQQNFSAAAIFLDKFPELPQFADFLVPARARALWGRARRAEARGLQEAAYPSLGPAAKADVAAFLCFEEVWNDCSQVEAKSCETFSRVVDEYSDVLIDYQAALTYLTKWECENNGKGDYNQLLGLQMNDDVKTLVAALSEPGTDGFNDILEAPEADSEHILEISRRLVGRTRSAGLLGVLQDEWAEKRATLAWERMGIALVEKYLALNDEYKAVVVGDKLMKNTITRNVPEKLVEQLVVAAYHTGQHERARELLANVSNRRLWSLAVNEPSTRGEDREPASDREFDEVVKALVLKKDSPSAEEK